MMPSCVLSSVAPIRPIIEVVDDNVRLSCCTMTSGGYLGTYTSFLLRLTRARSSGFFFAQVSTGDRLDPCHKRCISGRAPGPSPFSERAQQTFVRGELQSLLIVDKSQWGSIRDERVVFGNPRVKSRT
jgi:hypothetical protein